MIFAPVEASQRVDSAHKILFLNDKRKRKLMKQYVELCQQTYLPSSRSKSNNDFIKGITLCTRSSKVMSSSTASCRREILSAFASGMQTHWRSNRFPKGVEHLSIILRRLFGPSVI